VTIWPLAGAVAHRPAQRDDVRPQDFSSLRFFMWSGNALPVRLAEQITARTGVRFLCSYGMTDSMMVAFNPVDDPENWLLDSPGNPTEGTEVRLSAGGELHVRGNHRPPQRRLQGLGFSGLAPRGGAGAAHAPGGRRGRCGCTAHERTGEAAVAYVVAQSGDLTADALHDWVSTRLASYKRPREYRFVAALPRTVGGKVRRTELRSRPDAAGTQSTNS
jgi:long-chain acyl-CoA synthetase